MNDAETKELDILPQIGTPDRAISRPYVTPETEDQDQASRANVDPKASPRLTLSRTSTRASQITPAERVPRHKRRGLLGRLSLIPEVVQPYNYARRTKWLITLTVAASAAAAPMGSAIIMPTLLPISRDFHTSPTVTNMSVALYMLSMSIFPLWWSSFSETTGRRTIYIISFTLFVLFAILSAISTSIVMLIVMRLLSGGAAASVQAVGAGTIADIWEPKERGRAMGIFYLGPLCGPLLAPIIGGALAQGLGWRSTQWFLAGYGGLVTVMLTFVLPETLKLKRDVVAEVEDQTEPERSHSKVAERDSEAAVEAPGSSHLPPGRSAKRGRLDLTRTITERSIKLQAKKWIKVGKRILVDPLKIILLLRFPAVAITVYYASITFGSLYFLNVSIEDTFSRTPYNFSTLIVGLLYIPNSVGYFLASILGGRWLDHIMKREARRAGRIDAHGKLILRPEDRMRENAWLAAVVFPGALIWYGWSVQNGVFWLVPVCYYDCSSHVHAH